MKLFEDMFSSHRGAGVIGTVVAVGVLGVLGTLFILVFDEGLQGGAQTIESVIKDQGKQMDQLAATIVTRKEQLGGIAINKKTADEIASVSRQLESRLSRCQEAKDEIAQIQEAMAKNQSEWDAYTIAYRKSERAAEIGKQYPEITTRSGRSYKAVTIKKIDDLRVTVSHEGGSGTIAWNELPDELMDRLLFTKELAEQQQKAEQGAVAQISASAQEADIRTSMAYLKEKMEEATRAFEVQSSYVAQSRAKIIESESQIRRLHSLISGEANKDGLRQTPRYRSQIKDHEKTIEAERQRISDFATVQQNHEKTMRDLNDQWEQLNQKLQKVPK